MNETSVTTQQTVSDAALLDMLELMAVRSRGRQARSFAVWLAEPRSRARR